MVLNYKFIILKIDHSLNRIPDPMRIVFVALFIVYFYSGLQAQDPRENFKFAKFKFDNGDYSEALAFLDKAIEKDSTYISAFFLRAEVFYRLGQYYSTILDINHIFQIEDGTTVYSGDYYITRGKAFLALKNFPSASDDFDIAEILSENNPELYYFKASLEQVTGNYKHALDNIDQAINLANENPEYYALRSEIKILDSNPAPESEEYHSVLSDINVAIALNPDNYEYYLIRSNFLKSMGEVDAALDDYNKMLELSPNQEMVYTKRGMTKMNNDDYRSAALDFTKSIIINPDDEQNYRYRGLCYNNLNNYSEAYKDFTKSIDLLTVQLSSTAHKSLIKNTLAETYLLRGHCLNLMGNNAQACRDFLMAHNLGIKKGLNYYRKYCGIY